ncbi:hypothetical protein CWATWH0005_1281 [Crocosphaera watsonii WH 0005]|uniref:Uncharacterized protein n=1 Tax=Crocosphaera watsonii WH 0005 TaxID=423472 RepID=T2IWD2_CROWT|nr:hypothetical protein CWATWH0005_1281 [Crocosphaera watsonii WH 0005]
MIVQIVIYPHSLGSHHDHTERVWCQATGNFHRWLYHS